MIREDKEQMHIAEKIADYFSNGVKNIVLSAPTGSGKSGIAWFTHKLSDKSTAVLSHQKVLQDQYFNLLGNLEEKEFITLKGKDNYNCLKSDKLTVATAPCSYSIKYPCIFKSKFTCKYFRMRKLASTTGFLNANYQQIFSIFDSSPIFDLKKKIYIFDECHNLYDIYTSFRTTEITDMDLSFYKRLNNFFENEELNEICNLSKNAISLLNNIDPLKAEDNEQYGIDFINDLFKIKNDVYTILCTHIEKNLEDLIQTGKIASYGLFAAFEQMKLNKYNTVLSHKEKIIDNGNFVIEGNDNSQNNEKKFSIKLIPLDISELFKYESEFFSDNKLFMSSTIFGSEKLLKDLGLINENFEIIELDSKFPLENRKVYLMPIKYLSNKVINSDNPNELDEYYNCISEIVKGHASNNENGIIFSPSYKFTKMIVDGISKNINDFVDIYFNLKAEDRDSVLNYFTSKSDKPKILISCSFYEGVNFSDDLSRYQIIAKVPFKSLGSKYTRIKMERDKISYSLDALKLIVQGSGRSIRSINDYAVTYILDGNAIRVFNNCKNYTPKWYKDAIEKI